MDQAGGRLTRSTTAAPPLTPWRAAVGGRAAVQKKAVHTRSSALCEAPAWGYDEILSVHPWYDMGISPRDAEGARHLGGSPSNRAPHTNSTAWHTLKRARIGKGRVCRSRLSERQAAFGSSVFSRKVVVAIPAPETASIHRRIQRSRPRHLPHASAVALTQAGAAHTFGASGSE